MGAEAVEHDGDAHVGRVEAAQVAAEREELDPALVGRDVPIEPVPAQVVAGEQMPHPVRAGVGGAPATARLVGAAAAGGPLLAGVRLQVERPKLVELCGHPHSSIYADTATMPRGPMLDANLRTD